jgi:hypothetical protein
MRVKAWRRWNMAELQKKLRRETWQNMKNARPRWAAGRR